MQISTSNISKMVTNRANITIAINYDVAYMSFQLSYLDLTIARSKGQGQVHVHFQSEYLQNGDRSGKHYYHNQIRVARGLSIGIFRFDLGLF